MKTVFLTAYNRPEYLRPVIESWTRVRSVPGWNLVFSLEPSNRLDEMLSIIKEHSFDVPNSINVNDHIIGAPSHPWMSFERAFESGSQYVVSTEDDLLVTPDFLEYHEWASDTYAGDFSIAAVCAFSHDGSDESRVFRAPNRQCWGFGIWEDRWKHYIRDTWDHNYSTFNERPHHQAGWDWHLNTRLFPFLKKLCIHPEVTRIDNIGVHGVHGTASNFDHSNCYHTELGPVEYQER